MSIEANSNRLLVKDTIVPDGSLPAFVNRELVYNDAGRLFQLIEEGTLKATYIYNDLGQRTNKTIHNPDTTTNTTLYHYDQFGQLISETSDTGLPQRDYCRAPDSHRTFDQFKHHKIRQHLAYIPALPL